MRCIIHFYDEWNDFRLGELSALLELFNQDPLTSDQWDYKGHYLEIDLESKEIAEKICSRALLIKEIIELWAFGANLTSSVIQLKNNSNIWYSLSNDPNLKWSIEVDSYFKTINAEEKDIVRAYLQFLNFDGKVDVKNSDMKVIILLDYSSYNKHDPNPLNQPKFEESLLEMVEVPCFIGRSLAMGGCRDALRKYDLKKRKYLGPTSLDHGLALIMANLACLKKGNFVLDPFVGTGSILVALAHFGGRCFGSDIDNRVLHGQMYAGGGDRSIKRSIRDNFLDYNLELPELIRIDNHLIDRHLRNVPIIENIEESNCCNSIGLFDCIVTDPPYGIRAGARKSGKKHPINYVVPDELRSNHIPPTQVYDVEEVMLDLLHTAAKYLVVGGKLVYLIPTTYDFTENDLPKHPCLRLVQLCQQELSSRHGRHCVVVKKFEELTKESDIEFRQYCNSVLSGQDEGFGKLKSKLEAALALSGADDDNVVKKLSHAAIRRKESKNRRIRGNNNGTIS